MKPSSWINVLGLALLVTLYLEKPSVDVAGATLRFSGLILAVAAPLVIWQLVSAYRTKQVDYLDVALLTLIVGFAVISSGGINPLGSLRYVLYLAIGFVAYWLAKQLFAREQWRNVCVGILIVGALLQVGIQVIQFIGNGLLDIPAANLLIARNYDRIILGFPRPHGLFLEPLYMGFALHLPIALALTGSLRGWARGWYTPALSVLILGLILTTSRGAFLGFAALLVLFLLVLCKKWRQLLVGRTLLALGIGIGVGLLMLQAADWHAQRSVERGTSSSFQHAFGGDGFESGGAVMRFATFREAARIFSDQPIQGVGYGMFGTVSNEGKDEITVNPIVNNLPLEILSETGLLGLMLSLWVLAVVVVTARQAMRTSYWYGLAVSSALLAILVQYQFLSTLYIIHVWVALGMLAAVARGPQFYENKT